MKKIIASALLATAFPGRPMPIGTRRRSPWKTMPTGRWNS